MIDIDIHKLAFHLHSYQPSINKEREAFSLGFPLFSHPIF